MTDAQQSTTPESVIAAFDAAWARFVAVVDCFPAERADEAGPNATWSLRQIVGHVAFWDGYEADHLQRRHEITEVDWQAMNDQNISDSAMRRYAELRSEMDANHQRLAAAMRQPHRLDVARLTALTCDHYHEHAAELDVRLTFSD